ncbi:ABC transporter ATP-binding protein [Striga asiatica]|uniref:ABC transporter ATP-binding protein n=1 Tax=Striga asiatica TaxID=4170 RepID=A0A5A7P2J1_STRAF|nr:ABC transporter ATP-binding protein [Striga asiatica]
MKAPRAQLCFPIRSSQTKPPRFTTAAHLKIAQDSHYHIHRNISLSSSSLNVKFMPGALSFEIGGLLFGSDKGRMPAGPMAAILRRIQNPPISSLGGCGGREEEFAGEPVDRVGRARERNARRKKVRERERVGEVDAIDVMCGEAFSKLKLERMYYNRPKENNGKPFWLPTSREDIKKAPVLYGCPLNSSR